MCEQNSQNRRCTHNIHWIFGVLSERLGAICFWCRSCCCLQSGANCIHCYSFICYLVCIPFSDVFFCSRRLTAIAIETIKNNKKNKTGCVPIRLACVQNGNENQLRAVFSSVRFECLLFKWQFSCHTHKKCINFYSVFHCLQMKIVYFVLSRKTKNIEPPICCCHAGLLSSSPLFSIHSIDCNQHQSNPSHLTHFQFFT